MARMSAAVNALNAGEVSKIALARVDLAKMRLAAACQVNWVPFVIGPMMLRPGLQTIGEILNDAPAKIIRFVFAKNDTALIELTNNQARFWINDVLVSRVAVSTIVNDPNLFTGTGWTTADTTSGASITFGASGATFSCQPVGGLARLKQTITVAMADFGKEHALRFVIANGPVTVRGGSADGLSDFISQTVLDTGTHSIAFTPSSSMFLQVESTDARNKVISSISIEAAGDLILPTPWALADLPNVRYDQSGDIIFEACYGQQQRKIERRGSRPGARGFSIVIYKSDDGPFGSLAPLEANVTPSVYYGNGTLTSDQSYFQPSHVGALYRLFSTGQFNQAVLGAQNAFSQPVRVVGVGTASRNYSWTITGTWVGTITLQRSFDGPTTGFVDVSTTTINATLSSNTGGSGGTPPLDNSICWERVGFKGGQYTSGNATVISSYAGGGGYGICRVTGYNTQTSVNIEVLQPFSTLTATNDWVETQWSGYAGWPTTVAFHEGRLGWAGRSQLWASSSDDFTDYAEIDNQGAAVGDAGPINVTMGSGPFDTISWLLSLSRLQIGREQSIGSARSSNFDQPLTPTQIVIRDSSDEGADRLPAVKAGKRGIFVQQSGVRVYELAFNSQEMDYDDRDLTRLNVDIGATGFVDVDKVTQPDKMVYLPRGDGQCAGLLYDVKDEIEAWWRMQTLGVIENVAVLPTDGFEDLKYFVVKRTINGVTRRFLEKQALIANCKGGTINQLFDCHRVYQGSPVSTLQVSWLPNTLVGVWADGNYIGTATTDSSGNCLMPDGLTHGNIVVGLGGVRVIGSIEAFDQNNVAPNVKFSANSNTLTVGTQYNGYPAEVFADIGGTGKMKHVGPLTVSGGVVTIPNNQVASTIVAFLGFMAPFMSAKLAYGAQRGTALTQKKKVDHVGMLLFDTHYQGLQFGQRFDALDSLPQIESDQATPAGTVWTEYDEQMIEVPGEYDTDSRLCLLAAAPMPAMVGAVVVDVVTDEG